MTLTGYGLSTNWLLLVAAGLALFTLALVALMVALYAGRRYVAGKSAGRAEAALPGEAFGRPKPASLAGLGVVWAVVTLVVVLFLALVTTGAVLVLLNNLSLQ